MQLILLGSSYRHTTLDRREKFALTPAQADCFLEEATNHNNIHECIFVSTCNRTEVYAITEKIENARAFLIDLLGEYTQLSEEVLEESLYTYYNKFAAEHLFKVAAGLDSMVIGEVQILGQIKSALKQAQSLNTSGTILNQLFQYALQTGKKVRSETDIAKKPASVGSVATSLVQGFVSTEKPNILLIGTGKIGEVTIKNIRSTSPASLTVANRSQKRIEALTAKMDINNVITLEDIPNHIAKMDVVIVCTSAPHYVLDHSISHLLVKKQLLIDLSVPRNIDPALNQLEHVTLIDIDSLQSQAQLNQQERLKFVKQAESIIFQGMAQYLEWFNSLNAVPTIESLYTLLNDIRQREIQRAMPKEQPMYEEVEVIELLEKVTRSMTQKILHYPVMQLRMEPNPRNKQNYIDVLSKLFSLESEDYIDRYIHRQKVKTGRLNQSV